MKSWFSDFTDWVSNGSCTVVTPATIPGQKVILPQTEFYTCLDEWFLVTDTGKNDKKNIVLDSEGKIQGWRQFVTPIKKDNTYVNGVQYLSDLDRLEGEYGITSTYSYSTDMLTYEMFVVLVDETLITCFLTIFVVFLVVLVFTGSLFISGLSVFSVFLVELFIIAIIPMSDLTFNNLSVVHLLASLGLSVLYSVHISHRYLLVEAPKSLPVQR